MKMKTMDKVRAHREMLKSMWFNMDHSNIPVRKEIIVTLRDNPYWPGYGDVQILEDGPDCYCSFKTHQKNPIEYAKERLKEDKHKEFKLIIKDETNK
jgi:hypothetical protein